MGFLEAGIPLSWWSSLPHIAYIREHGVEQFIRIFNAVKGRTNDVLKWGDEVRGVRTRGPRSFFALPRAPLLRPLPSPPPCSRSTCFLFIFVSFGFVLFILVD